MATTNEYGDPVATDSSSINEYGDPVAKTQPQKPQTVSRMDAFNAGLNAMGQDVMPVASAANNSNLPPVIKEAATLGGVGLDFMTSPFRLIDKASDLITGGAQTRSYNYIDQAIPTGNNLSDIPMNLLNQVAKMAVSPSSLFGVGAIKKALTPAAKLAEAEMQKTLLSGGRSEANSAAARSSIPLTEEQKIAPVGSQNASGILGRADEIVSKIPGGRGVMQGFRQTQRDAIIAKADELRGSNKSSEEIAQDLAQSVDTKLSTMKKEFSEGYQYLQEQGTKKSNVKMFDPESVAQTIRNSLNQNRRLFSQGEIVGADTPTGLTASGKSTIGQYVKDIENLKTLPDVQQYERFREIKTNLYTDAKAAFKNGYSTDGNVLMQAYDKSKDAEMDYLQKITNVSKNQFKAAGEFGNSDLVSLVRNLNSFYHDTYEVRAFAKKAIGQGVEEGQKGYVTADKAMDNLLNNTNKDALAKIMQLNDPATNDAIRLGMRARIIDKARIENGTMLSANKLQAQIDKYGEQSLSKVLGQDYIDGLRDFVVGMRRARSDKLKYVDPSNPSGTGNITAILMGLGGGELGNIFHGGLKGVAAGLITASTAAVASRIVAKMLTGQSKIGNTITKLSKAAPAVVGAATNPNRTLATVGE